MYDNTMVIQWIQLDTKKMKSKKEKDESVLKKPLTKRQIDTNVGKTKTKETIKMKKK